MPGLSIVRHIQEFNLERRNQKFTLFHNKEKGQGLVEYALILVLVAIVVIVVLNLLGPIIGRVFSSVNDSLSGAMSVGGGGVLAVPAPTDPTDPASGFSSCANDGGSCNLSGTHTVMYGADGTYVTVMVDGPFTCLPQGWSGSYPVLPVEDPVPGVVKTCHVK